jgi:hypothetical protein
VQNDPIDTVYSENIFQTHFFRYLQIRNFTRKIFPSFLSLPPISWLDEFLNLDPFVKGHISKLYDMIKNFACPTLDHVKHSWEGEFGSEISDISPGIL